MSFNTQSDHDAMRQANIFLAAEGYRARLNFGLGQTARFDLNGDPNPNDPNPNDAAQPPAGQHEQPTAPQEQPAAQDEQPFNAWNPSQPPNPRNPFDERNYKVVNGKTVSAHTVAEIHRLNAWHDAKNKASAKAPSPDRPKRNVFSFPIGESSSSKAKARVDAELDAPYYGPASSSRGSAPRATRTPSSKSKNPFACDPFANVKKAPEAKKPAVKKPLEIVPLSMIVGKLAEKEKDKKKKDKKEKESFEVVDLTGPVKKLKKRKRDDEDDDNDRSCNWIGLGVGSKRPKMKVKC